MDDSEQTFGPPGPEDRLVIRPEDLPDDVLPEPPRPPTWDTPVASGFASGGSLPPLGPTPATLQVAVPGSGSGLTKLGANSVVSGLLGGAVGGLVGAIAVEVFYNPEKHSAFTESDLKLQSGYTVAIVGALLGFVLLAWDGITSGAAQKGFRDGASGAIVGAVAGFVGGYVAQIIFTNILKDATFDNIKSKAVLARVLAWAIFGVLLGAGLGIKGGGKKVANGLIGGVLGGAAGGLLFQLIENSNDGSSSVTTTRFLGFACTGAGIGLAVGLVERARRESWLTITAGPMAGKEFILYNARTVIGADFHCNIVLARDPTVAPQHLAFDRSPQGAIASTLGGRITVNGVEVTNHRLRSGDQIAVGSSVLTYQERAVTTTGQF
jgi:Inner membrane component of T3SS, cytoplasmic domain